MKLLHKLLPERVTEKTLASIARDGLIARLPSEYKSSLPAHLQSVPLVWLAGKMNTVTGVIYSVDTGSLGAKDLHKLDWDGVVWWVYQGNIPSHVVEKLIDTGG